MDLRVYELVVSNFMFISFYLGAKAFIFFFFFNLSTWKTKENTTYLNNSVTYQLFLILYFSFKKLS